MELNKYARQQAEVSNGTIDSRQSCGLGVSQEAPPTREEALQMQHECAVRRQAAIETLREALEQALRQWASYYGEHNSDDIEIGRHSEAAAYRKCKAALELTK